jgi:hypothetical protein
MKKLSKGKINYRKTERILMNRTNRKLAKKAVREGKEINANYK